MAVAAVAVPLATAVPAGSATTTVTCVGPSLAATTGSRNEAGFGVDQALCNGTFAVVMQADGNLVEYRVSGGTNTPVWASGTSGTGASFAGLAGGDLQVGPWQTRQTGPYQSERVGSSGDPTFVNTPSTLNLAATGNLRVTLGGGSLKTNLWQNGGNGSGYVQILSSGTTILSPGGLYRLAMQTDGNLVLSVKQATGWLPLWSTGTETHQGAFAVLQTDGNLIVHTARATTDSGVLWASGSSAYSPSLSVQRDGNVVVYGTNAGGTYAAWASQTNGLRGSELLQGQALQPGQTMVSANLQYRLTMGTAGVLVLYSVSPYACPIWLVPAAKSLTGYTFTPQANSYLQLTSWGDLALWRQGQVTGSSEWDAGITLPSGGHDYLVLQTDGNLVAYPASQMTSVSRSGTALWASNTGAGGTRGYALCTGSVLEGGQTISSAPASYHNTENQTGAKRASTGTYSGRVAMQEDCNLVAYETGVGYSNTVVWESSTSQGRTVSTTPAAPGYHCYAELQTDGNLVVVFPNDGSAVEWQSGTNQTGTPVLSAPVAGPYIAVFPLHTPTSTTSGEITAQFDVSTYAGTVLGTPSVLKSTESGGRIANQVGSLFSFGFRYAGAYGYSGVNLTKGFLAVL